MLGVEREPWPRASGAIETAIEKSAIGAANRAYMFIPPNPVIADENGFSVRSLHSSRSSVGIIKIG